MGVGKSTQIRMLTDYFRSLNNKSVVTYINSVHGLTYILYLWVNMVTKGVAGRPYTKKNLVLLEINRKSNPLWRLSDGKYSPQVSVLGVHTLSARLQRANRGRPDHVNRVLQDDKTCTFRCKIGTPSCFGHTMEVDKHPESFNNNSRRERWRARSPTEISGVQEVRVEWLYHTPEASVF